MAQTGMVTLHCKECRSVLARKEILMLATIPPSHCHLAVKEGQEDEACAKLTKVENPKGGNSAQYCPYIFHCQECDSHVGNVTILSSKQLICYKTDNIYIYHDGKEIKARRLKNITKTLEQQCGIEVVNVSPQGEIPSWSPRSSGSLIYCDTSRLTHTSREIDSLTRQNPRDYQRELFLFAMSRNTLVYLPTGSGKTLIAAMVLSCMKKLNPNKLMVFLVDRVPLAYQQSDYIKSQVPDLRVETLVGEMEPSQQRRIHQLLADIKVDLLVLTHQIFLNFLAVTGNQPVRLTDVSVLVFDEAHHCRGNHQYKQIMAYYKNTANKFKPVVLGLTASPAGEITVERTSLKLEELLENLCCSIAMPVLTSSVIHVNIPDTVYDVSECMSIRHVVLRGRIEDYVEYLKTMLQTEDAPGRQTLQELPLFSPNFRGALRRLIDSCHGNKRRKKTLIAGEHAMHMLSVIDLNEVLGYHHAMECLRDCVYRTIQAASPKESALKKLIGSQPTFLALRALVDNVAQGDAPVSDRYNILVKHLKHFVARAGGDETSRGIVFVSMRKTAYKLCEQIRTIPDVMKTLNPEPFVGHGQGSYDGMAWREEQEELLKQFRSGITKLLICTSVLEEGLDVPECNLVIRFQGAASLRALVQTRGRASRRPDSTFVVICNEKEKEVAEDSLLREQNMEKAIRFLMHSQTTKSQAELFECEVKKPNLVSDAEKSSEDVQIERYNPNVTVLVHNLAGQKHRVKDFLNNNFKVMSSKVIQSPSVSSEATESNPTPQHMEFELQPNEDGDHDFRSQEEFIHHVTEVWCSRLTNQDEEPLPVCLQSFLPKKRRRPEEPIHELKANSLFLGTFIDRCHFRSEWPSEPILKNVQINFDHSLKILTVFFFVQGSSYKLELRYDELEDFITVDSNMNAKISKVFLSVRHPPRLYKDTEDNPPQDVHGAGQDGQDVDEGIHVEQDAEDDLNDSMDDRSDSESEGFSTDEDYPDVVRNFHERTSPDSSEDNRIWERVPDIGNSENAWSQCFTYCLTIPSTESIKLRRLLTSIERRFDKKSFYCRVKESFGRLPDITVPPNLPFDVKYAAQSVISFHPEIRGRQPGTFGGILQSKSRSMVINALDKLKKALEQDKFCNPCNTLETQLNQNSPSTSGIQNRLVPSHCALIKRAVITPTKLLLYQPEVMVKNRVLRNYETDDFLCVSIRDEDLSKLSAARGSVDLVLDEVQRVLDEGLGIAGQRFHFLGSSNSQLRNHSCWFVGPSLQPDEVRRWMGDFTNIKCVASYMARMGQCFSTSMDTVGFAISEETFYRDEDDVTVKTDDQKYCFSDGIGRISEELAAEVVKKIAKPFKPSAFQIRFAGYKGVLALDPSLQGKQALLRPSMYKFDSFHRRLEVLQTSRPQAVYLNHQVIMLLSNLGVPDEVFIQLQNNMLDQLARMLVNERDAIQLLGNGAKMGVSYHSLSTAGIPLTTEPFFKSLLVAMYRNSIHELLFRARIRLPPAGARLMMGVMDELGVLKPGQVYVQYSEESKREDREEEFNKNRKRVVKGPVVVTRNPCLHPGDVRQLEAVDKPQLGHLVDCIVFPRQGQRPHPNEMAGGDLDGDLYFVCWNESLLPRKPNYPPMDYPALQKLEQDEPITAAHMTKFVVDYIRSDQLGVIDNAHKALADVEKGGVESEICLHLAELHSLAVDAPKTGKWPQMPKMRPLKKFPDFMMKSDKASYPSDKLLGKLYRRCRKFKDTASEKHSQKMRVDSSFLLSGHAKYIAKAREVYDQYRTEMEALMRLYGIETEAEVFTGCFLKLRNRLRKEKTEIAEIVGERLFAMRSGFRREFFREFEPDGESLVDSTQISNEMLLKASAWYQVAYTHAHEHEDDSDPVHGKRLLGLPWFINDIMLAIKERKEPPCSISAQALDVRTMVGRSLAKMFLEEKSWLLEDLKTRVNIKNRISRHLRSFQPNHSLTMIGSSATLLFHQKSDLDLCILPQVNHTSSHGVPAVQRKENSTSIDDQVKTLQVLIPHLKEETPSEEQERESATNLFRGVRLVNKKHFPVLVCKWPTEKLQADSNCPSNLSCDLSSSPDSLNLVILLSSYTNSYPRLLLVLRAIHRWCCVTGVSRNAAGAGNISNILATLLLVQCMRKGLIANFNEEYIAIKRQQLVQGGVMDGAQYMEQENIIQSLEESCSENPTASPLTQAELDTAQLGTVLMTFFQTHDSSFEKDLPDTLARTLHVPKLTELLDKEHLVLVKEHMQRAYQLLALYGDVQIMLAISGSEDYNVIFLSPILSTYLAGVEKSKAQEIARKTGATSIVIRPSFSRSRASAILEVKGSEPAIRAVERELEKMSVQASSDRWSLMSNCFVEDASLLLFEGSRNQNDHVTLTPYDGPCHQTHDSLARHLALLDLKQATLNNYAFCRFIEKFFQQLRVLERDFDPQLHGCYEFAVHFGRVYMFSVPHSLLEDSESITIAMLRANKRKSTIPQENRQAPKTVKFANQETERDRRRRRRPKRAVSTDENRKKRVRAKPSRSSFFTVMHSPERAKAFLLKSEFRPDPYLTEKYLVDICDDEVEFYVRFDNNLNFVEIKFPNLRWCMVDVKRPWQRRPDRDVVQDGRETDDDVMLDGWETDVRFLLQTRFALGPCDIRDTKYAKYQHILQPSDAVGAFKVQEDLWKQVKLIRVSRLRKFKHVSPPGGFLSGLTVYLGEVTEYSRPKPEVNVFGREVTRWEVSLEATLPTDDEQGISFKCPAKETMKTFLNEVWKFAFSLSSFVSGDMEQEN